MTIILLFPNFFILAPQSTPQGWVANFFDSNVNWGVEVDWFNFPGIACNSTYVYLNATK